MSTTKNSSSASVIKAEAESRATKAPACLGEEVQRRDVQKKVKGENQMGGNVTTQQEESERNLGGANREIIHGGESGGRNEGGTVGGRDALEDGNVDRGRGRGNRVPDQSQDSANILYTQDLQGFPQSLTFDLDQHNLPDSGRSRTRSKSESSSDEIVVLYGESDFPPLPVKEFVPVTEQIRANNPNIGTRPPKK